MKTIQEINWNIFKAKFNGDEDSKFEWLCYLLFCKEYSKPNGILRFKNQTGIETNPIQIDDKIIGWQSKYCDTGMSSIKTRFIDSIKKTSETYPDINEIIFYTNKDFGQTSAGDDPAYKIEIEDYAKSKAITINWRTGSYFESPFVVEENSSIIKYFFSSDNSVLDLVNSLSNHTNQLLSPIQSSINFNSEIIKIERTQIISEIIEGIKSYSMLIVSGEAGVGKTAVIKDIYDDNKMSKLFYLFKATEFNISNITQLFNDYGDYTLNDFIKCHDNIDNKIIIIDSAEKLFELDHPTIFQEFISTTIDNNWTIIFTTRLNYLDDLKYLFVDVYHQKFNPYYIPNIPIEDLNAISKTYKFHIPSDKKLIGLICNPFYLNEYLKNYEDYGVDSTYSEFKEKLWSKQIANSSNKTDNIHIRRENCFINIALKRAIEGLFYVVPDDCDDVALKQLETDELISYDSKTRGYFITQDIYEDLALEKMIEQSFAKSKDNEDFFNNIGSSLSIRRSFRLWLSNKLLKIDSNFEQFIIDALSDEKIAEYWIDEIIVSILLSDYSENFFKIFEKELRENDESLLLKIIFLARVACKEIDSNLLARIGMLSGDNFAYKTLFTNPRGNGWKALIKFVYDIKDDLKTKHINIILPLLNDWSTKYKEGETTKYAGQIALLYYNILSDTTGFNYSSNDDRAYELIKVIFNSSFEIVEEIDKIIDEAINLKSEGTSNKHHQLIVNILSSAYESVEITKNLPEQVIRLAEYFWLAEKDSDDWRIGHSIGVEQYFGIAENIFRYHPASAFQTPIYILLTYSYQPTLDFILSFTNKTTECYKNSKFGDEIEEVVVYIDESKTIKQYNSNRLWQMYRGNQVSTNLLESIHMALEKWLLEKANDFSQKELIKICKYLVENSVSTSITSVILSIVLANPYKLFDVAKILMRTKTFFYYDTARMISDQTILDTYSIGYGLMPKDKIFDDERIKTCSDNHRKMSFENLILHYQLFYSENETKTKAQERIEYIHNVLDNYYKELESKPSKSPSDETWELCLAKMDRRKMKISSEEKDGNLLVKFDPQIDPGLKKRSAERLKSITDDRKYIKLSLWSMNRYENKKDGYSKYCEYENDCKKVIKEVKEIESTLNSNPSPAFIMFNASIPSYACSVLMRDFIKSLNTTEKNFCKKIIIRYAQQPLEDDYKYQISDGIQPAINVLPLLIKLFPKETTTIKSILFFNLYCNYPIGSNNKLSDYSINAISNILWTQSFEDANSLFLGYLSLGDKYYNLSEEIRRENYKNSVYSLSTKQVLDEFQSKFDTQLKKIYSNSLAFKDIIDIDKINIETLTTAFELLPDEIEDNNLKEFVEKIIHKYSLLLSIEDNKIDYQIVHRFLKKYPLIMLNLEKDDIPQFIQPFIEHFKCTSHMVDLFNDFISTEDQLEQYESFWIIWHAFYPKIVALCMEPKLNSNAKSLVRSYLLAWPYWKSNARDWHSLKDREKLFYLKAVKDIGHQPVVLYSISKFLNEIGSKFLDDGIVWLNKLIKNNYTSVDVLIDENTIYYIEKFIRNYFISKRFEVKNTPRIREYLLIVLNFLVQRGSVTGYLLREEIL